MRKWLSRGLLVLAALGVLALVVYGYLPKPVAVEVVEARDGPLQAAIEEDGKTRVRDRYTLFAPVTGSAMRIVLRPGALVAQGQTVAELVPLRSPLLDPQARATAQARLEAALDAKRRADAAVEQAQTALQQASVDLKRARILAKAQSMSEMQLQQAEFAARSRRSELNAARYAADVAGHEIVLARAALASYSAPRSAPLPVPAPVGGQVLRVLHESEGPVGPGTALVEIGDLQSLEVVAEALTRDAVQLAPGMRAVIERWGGPAPLEGRVRRIEPSAFTRVSPLGVEEQRVNVIVSLEDPLEKRRGLGDQFAVDVRFITWESERVLTVPNSALFRQGDGWALFVLDGARARLRRVSIGHRGALSAEVLTGLRAGERVVIHPPDTLADGVRVDAR